MSKEELLTRINAESATLAATKLAFKAALEARGMTPTDVFASYAPLIESITGGTVTVQDSKTVTFNGISIEVGPDEGYDGIRKVILAGDPNLKALNIVDAITMYGVTGSAKVAVSDGTEWPFPDPVDPENPQPGEVPNEGGFDNEAEKDDPDVPKTDMFVLADDQGNITKAYLYGDEFEITFYDPVTTEFKAKGWRRVSWHTTGENAGTYTRDNFRTEESGGWNYLKNIRSCTREKLYYQGVEVWPKGQYLWNYNGVELPVLPVWNKETYPHYLVMVYTTLYGKYVGRLYLFKSIAYGSHGTTDWGITTLADGYAYCDIDKLADMVEDLASGVWGDIKEAEGQILPVRDSFVLSNFDVLNADGTVYLAASDPIPV